MDEDSKLVALAQGGDKSAFNQLVERHYDKVYRQALGMVKKEEDAKDVAQLAWIKAWKKLATFKGDSAFTSWLYRITTFTAIDAIRKRKNRRETHADTEYLDYATSIDTSAVASTNQIRILESKELQKRFQQAIEKLPESQKQTITLREIDELSYDQIADKMNCKIGTVMSRLFNARKNIQKQLADFLT